VQCVDKHCKQATEDAGDLGAIDAKYDIAVSTSCGALDYVVVDNTGTAQCCVEMLRRRGLGVATFLILDKQQHLAKALQERPSPPEGQCISFQIYTHSTWTMMHRQCIYNWCTVACGSWCVRIAASSPLMHAS